MQTFKDKQQQLFKWNHLPEKTLDRLEVSWPGVWQREIIPIIDERLFSDLYCKNDGRPGKTTADMVGILILKEMEDLTDEETVGRVAFDIRWQYALDMSPLEAYVAERTLQYFREKIINSERHKALFEDLTDKIIVKLVVSFGKQRMDSSHVLSNMAILTRLGLFVKTITVFLRELNKVDSGSFGELGEELRKRYIERDGGRFGDARGSDARRRVEQCASDVWLLIERFKDDKKICSLKEFQILQRLFREQCVVEEGERVVVREAVSSDSLQSPFDEGAGYSGHKGKGYQGQFSETCDPTNDVQIITYVAVESADKSDTDAIVPAAQALESRGLKPEEMVADTAYCGGENDIALRDMGVELIGPAPGKEPHEKAIDIALFETSPNLKQVVKCPAGHEPLECAYDKVNGNVIAVFDKGKCLECDMRGKCGAKRRKEVYMFTYPRGRMAAAMRRQYEKKEEFTLRYAIRSGIEAANSELKRAHGMGRLRVRGQPAVEFAVFMKALACNVKRYLKARIERVVKAAKGENNTENSGFRGEITNNIDFGRFFAAHLSRSGLYILLAA